jgi:hypothetical protein
VALVGPDDRTIHSLRIYSGPLAIDLAEPVGDVRLKPGDLLPVRWRFPAAAGAATSPAAPLGVSVGVSYDGGQTFIPRVHRAQGNAVVLDARTLAEPMTVTLRVYALQNGMSGDDTTAGDRDGDRCPDPRDPAPTVPDTADSDGDGIPDACDLCRSSRDPLQTDADGDGKGDACDADYNNDGRVDNEDFTRYFQPCVGADVVARPECYDKDRNHDGIVVAADFCVPRPRGLCDDGDPSTGPEICSPVAGCQPAPPNCPNGICTYLPLIRRR